MKINILLLVTLLISLTGCSREIPKIAKNEGFSSINEITKDEYIKKLAEYKLESGKSKNIEISIIDKFIFPKSKYPVVIKKER